MNKAIFYSLIISCSILLCDTVYSYEHSWDKYTAPYFTTVNIPLSGRCSVHVNLPAEYINQREIVSLHIDIESNFTYMIDGLKEKGFEGFIPKLSLNGRKLFGCYNIPVKTTPANQSVKLDIKTKYLEVGNNELKFIFTGEPRITYKCKSGKSCIAYRIHKIWFDDFTSNTEYKINQLAMTEEGPKQVSYREDKNIDESFEGEIVNRNEWNFGEMSQQRTGKEGFQRIYIDKGQGANGTYRCLAMNFKLGSMETKQSEGHRLPKALLVNRQKRDLAGYKGIEFHVRTTKDLEMLFGLSDSETGNKEEERWNRIVSVTAKWKKLRIPFNSLSLVKNRALRKGTNQLLELNHIEAIHWVAHGRIVPFGTEGTIYLDEISFY